MSITTPRTVNTAAPLPAQSLAAVMARLYVRMVLEQHRGPRDGVDEGAYADDDQHQHKTRQYERR